MLNHKKKLAVHQLNDSSTVFNSNIFWRCSFGYRKSRKVASLHSNNAYQSDINALQITITIFIGIHTINMMCRHRSIFNMLIRLRSILTPNPFVSMFWRVRKYSVQKEKKSAQYKQTQKSWIRSLDSLPMPYALNWLIVSRQLSIIAR